MIRKVALMVGLLVVLVAAVYARRGPVYESPSRSLRWSARVPDAGGLTLEHEASGVQFFRAHDAVEPILAFGVMQRGDQYIVSDEFNSFHAVRSDHGRLWVLAEYATEGGGPNFELLVSDDDGATFEQRSVPKPVYFAFFHDWSIVGGDVALYVTVDDEVPLPDEWLWPWYRLPLVKALRPRVGPGEVVLRSRNGGRRWQLER